MKIGVFGGSFDPIQKEHKNIALEAIKTLSLDKLIVVPAYVPPFKEKKKLANFDDRVEMVKLAFKDVEKVEVSMIEYNPSSPNYTYITMNELKNEYPNSALYLIFGEDCLLSFDRWKKPKEIAKVCSIVPFMRCENGTSKADKNKNYKKFLIECDELSKKYNVEVLPMKYFSTNTSSTAVRVASIFGMELESYVESEIADYIYARHLYNNPKVSKGLNYLKKSRKEHSFYVTKMAISVANKYGLNEEKIILACGLHDVAKYLDKNSNELEGFDFKKYEDVPNQVLHQYTGEFVARQVIGETDNDVLNAIKYHTSGRANMSMLEKVVFLSDMLEETRDFPSIKKLRKLFYEDIDLCLCECFKHQINYLKKSKSKIYPLTLEGYESIKNKIFSKEK